MWLLITVKYKQDQNLQAPKLQSISLCFIIIIMPIKNGHFKHLQGNSFKVSFYNYTSVLLYCCPANHL